jgi:hypothetical protein
VALGAVLLAAAAGEPLWKRAGNGSILVMVDLSPSTRGATFRDRAALDLRVHQLLGDQPFQLLAFADHIQPMGQGPTLEDIPADQTIFAPPPADAIVLFSDGQFELPAYSPPTYPVIDPALDHPADAAVIELTQSAHQVIAAVTNTASPRPLKWTGATVEHPDVPAGNFSQLATPNGIRCRSPFRRRLKKKSGGSAILLRRGVGGQCLPPRCRLILPHISMRRSLPSAMFLLTRFHPTGKAAFCNMPAIWVGHW